MTAQLVEITGTVRDYAWGAADGIARALGRGGSGGPEAELWLGAHPSAPSRIASPAPWRDLAEWEQLAPGRVPFLLKVLAAGSPLSLQAHPTDEQAAAGFAREEAAGLARDARERNYKDPFAKPELIVALEDGFEALCGFRPVDETVGEIRGLAADAADPAVFAPWLAALETPGGVRPAFEWLLAGGDAVGALVDELTRSAAPRHPLVARLVAEYPGDPGIAIALMLNHVTLARGEALWLPAGNIHAYLSGTGVELMGPSDNVLRGGLTPKHVDTAELSRVLDFTPGPAPYLPAAEDGAHTVAYRPRSLPSGAGVPFELLEVTGDDAVSTTGPAIALVVEGAFTLTTGEAAIDLDRGTAVFLTDAGELGIRGAGRLFIAAA